MGELAVILILYLVAMLILVAEIFIPSHGILSIAGLTFLVVAIVRTFAVSERAGIVAILGSAVILPIAMALAIKVWPRTFMGRAIAPKNPVVSSRDVGVGVVEMRAMVGREGRVVTPLRPVGTCEFDGCRFQCTAEMGMIEAGADVQVVGIQGSSLTVAARRGSASA